MCITIVWVAIDLYGERGKMGGATSAIESPASSQDQDETSVFDVHDHSFSHLSIAHLTSCLERDQAWGKKA
jgi:hypothetical protein